MSSLCLFSIIFLYHIGPHTFELVTASKVLHVRATTSYEVSAWIEAIKVAIGKSYLGMIKNLSASQSSSSPLNFSGHSPFLPFISQIISSQWLLEFADQVVKQNVITMSRKYSPFILPKKVVCLQQYYYF